MRRGVRLDALASSRCLDEDRRVEHPSDAQAGLFQGSTQNDGNRCSSNNNGRSWKAEGSLPGRRIVSLSSAHAVLLQCCSENGAETTSQTPPKCRSFAQHAGWAQLIVDQGQPASFNSC